MARLDLTVAAENFAYSYVRAIGFSSGFNVHRPEVDVDSKDLWIEETGDPDGDVPGLLQVQVKSFQAHEEILTRVKIPYKLKLKNYDDLRSIKRRAPIILVVVVVPKDQSKWCLSTAGHLKLLRRAYWLSLHGRPPWSGSQDTKPTVQIPTAQRFTPLTLPKLMKKAGTGGLSL